MSTKNTAQSKTSKRNFTGQVISVGAFKTIHVVVENLQEHPKYRKQYTRAKKYAVHDETGAAKLGDLVVVAECRPLSKTKRWRLVRVMKSNPAVN